LRFLIDAWQLDKVWAHARFEIITQLRGWFFRIFSALAISILVLMSVIFFTRASDVPHIFYALSASPPYMSMILLNMAQVVAIVLLATDIFKRDKKINTIEVFYIRPMTNASYIFGRALGILLVFFLLDIFILLVSATLVLIFGKVPINWPSYLWYLILIPFPTMVFLLGLTAFFMRIIKNQAVVVLLVLGYYAAVIFYLRAEWNFLFDFPAMNLPLIYSDFVGIARLPLILMQRSVYLAAGIIFLSLTTLFFTRLPQSLLLKRLLTALIIVLSTLTFCAVYAYQQTYLQNEALRSRMIALNNRYAGRQNIEADQVRIKLEHRGNEIRVRAGIVYHNPGDQPLNRFWFSLNPELIVQEINNSHQTIRFERQDHLLFIEPQEPLAPGAKDSCQILYHGGVNDAACYLDIPGERLEELYMIWLFQITKKYSFVSSDYVLLSEESLWYPQTSLPASPGTLDQQKRSFSSFELGVTCRKDLLAISQGKRIQSEAEEVIFRPEMPLPAVSLIIGPYERRTLPVEDITYELYFLSAHNYFDTYLPAIGDTLSTIIHESRQSYEVTAGLNYPFKRMAFIEVPIQFYTYPRIWTVATENIQPEQIWLPESAVILPAADFRFSKAMMERRLDHSNQTLTDLETETTILKQFINGTFLGEMSFMGRRGGPRIEYEPDYNLFPTFYSYTNFVRAGEWPIINTAMEAYLYKRAQKAGDDMRMAFSVEGLTTEERVSRKLSQKSLAAHLASGDTLLILPEIVRTKGAYLFDLLRGGQSRDEFNKNLNQLIETYRFRRLDSDVLFKHLFHQPPDSISAVMKDWYYSTRLPGFLISDLELYKVIDNNRVRYQIIFNISNPENVNGLAEVSFQFGRSRRSPFLSEDTAEEPAHVIDLAAGHSKQIGIVLDAEPRAVNIDFMIARNIPIIYTKQFDKAEELGSARPFDGEKMIDGIPVTHARNEIIVDNEDDDHFLVFNPHFRSMMKRWLQGEEEEPLKTYERFTWWRPAKRWTLIKSPSFFGTYIHSAYYIRSGDKNNLVKWQADLPAEGLYDVYCYMFDIRDFWRRWRRRSGSNSGFSDFNYTIRHGSGEDQVTLDAGKALDGWNFLGTYFFSKGQASVELSDRSKGELVIADAVKWVKN